MKKTFQRFCLIAGLFFLSGPMDGQEMTNVLKIDPVPLADPFVPGIGLAWQHRLKPGKLWYLENALGVLFPTAWSEPNVTRDLRGLRLRTSLQKYEDPFVPGKSNRFLGLMAHLQWSDRTMTADFRRSGAFFNQQIQFERPQVVLGLYFIFGFTEWWANERITLDFGAGAGPRVAINNPGDLPPDAEFITNGTPYSDHAPVLDRWTLGFTLLFRVGYVIYR